MPGHKPRRKEGAKYLTLNFSIASEDARAFCDHVVARIANEATRPTTRAKLVNVVAATTPSLLRAFSEGLWTYRATVKAQFSGERIGFRMFEQWREAMKGLHLIEHEPGGVRMIEDPWEEGGPAIVTEGIASHFRPTQGLVDLATSFGITAANLESHFKVEMPRTLVFLRDSSKTVKGKKTKGQRRPPPDTPEAKRCEYEVRAINDYLANIDIGGQLFHGFYRLFNQADTASFNWNKGGRLYTVDPASYQNRPKAERLAMTLDGQPVCEIDVSASYLTIYHGLIARDYRHLIPAEMRHIIFDATEDPYSLPGFERAVVKAWVSISLGRGELVERWSKQISKSFLEEHGKPIGEIHKAKDVRDAVLGRHPLLGLLNSLPISWADLMFHESEAIMRAMRELRERDIPSLPMHDCLIVPQGDEDIATAILKQSYLDICNIVPMIKREALR
ncbi:conserved hypothetical protein [Hyphomicrobiales bacterium]|nr:conserved hypothetical protein [Hyphomicrobiales bacterium]CAH1680400.1 conserved hypothetical protein [Hyphomicrobiales bacterium]